MDEGHDINSDFYKDAKVLANKFSSIDCEKLSTPDKKAMDEFVEASKLLNHYLPKLSDPTMSEINDLLYEVDDKDVDEHVIGLYHESHQITVEFISSMFFTKYDFLYTHVWESERTLQILDMTYLRILNVENILDVDLIRPRLYGTLEALISSRSVVKVCQALKLLRIALEKQSHRMCNEDLYEMHDIIAWVNYFTKIPQARNAKDCRITTWIKLQSLAIMDSYSKIYTNLKYELFYQVEGTKTPQDFEYIGCFLGDFFFIPLRYVPTAYILDFIIHYFESAKSENEKSERMRNFIKGCFAMRKYYAMEITTGNYVMSLKFVMKYFFDLLDSLFEFENGMRVLPQNEYRVSWLNDRYDSYTPEIPRNREDSLVVDSETIELPEIKNCDNGDGPPDQPDFTIEKYLILDDLIRCIKICIILNDVVQRTEELMESSGGLQGFDNELFRSNETARTYLNDILENPSKRGTMSWCHQFLFQKCPFLLYNQRHKNAVKELMKLIHGEEIDKVTEERLFFIINNCGVLNDWIME